MKSSINAGLLVGFCSFIVGIFINSRLPEALGLVIVGLVATTFHRELAEERYKIDKETKDEFLQKYLFSSETVGKNSIIFLIAGIFFLSIGCLITLSLLFQ